MVYAKDAFRTLTSPQEHPTSAASGSDFRAKADTVSQSQEQSGLQTLKGNFTNGSNDSQVLPSDLCPVNYVHEVLELPSADIERLEKLFKQLDRDGNGRIDIHDLSAALKEFGLSSQYAEQFLQKSDQTQSGDVGLAEFIHYIREHEKNLRLQFSHLDKNRDGKVDLEELISAFKDLGIDMDPIEAANLLQRMDQDGSLNISYDEWRDFLFFAPSSDIHSLIKFWRHSTVSNSFSIKFVPFYL